MDLQQKLNELLAIENKTEEQNQEIIDLQKQIAEAEIEKRIQSETDRVRGKYSKELKELKDLLKTLQDEKLTDEEKAKRDKEEKEDLLAKREQELAKKELDFDTLSLLSEKKLDRSFMPFLTGNSIEDRARQLDLLSQHINEKVAELVKVKLGSDVTNSNKLSNNGSLSVSLEEFNKMSYQEKTQLYLTNPELYNQLTN